MASGPSLRANLRAPIQMDGTFSGVLRLLDIQALEVALNGLSLPVELGTEDEARDATAPFSSRSCLIPQNFDQAEPEFAVA